MKTPRNIPFRGTRGPYNARHYGRSPIPATSGFNAQGAAFFGWPLLAGVLIALLIIQRYPQWVGLPSLDVNLQQAPQTTRSARPGVLCRRRDHGRPAVVNLYTTKVINKPPPVVRRPAVPPLLRRQLPKQRRMESSLGSGVIMSPEGYILTNNHVTTGADQIVVALKDGRETLARVIGSDPETDLAVLKIDLKNLPAITVGRSDNIRIGDVALAIGNPFGVGQTVTMGIISATGRNQLGLNNYEDFIQTDAAINPGNSGGALVDANGNLTGINTAIFSKSGGSQGIGFAIPVKLAMEVMKSIIEHGQVIRGWLGIEVQPLTRSWPSRSACRAPGHRRGRDLPRRPGAEGRPAAGDVILSIDGEPAGDGRKSMNQVARIKPTDKVTIQVMRNGKELKLTAEIGLRPPPAPVKEESNTNPKTLWERACSRRTGLQRRY
jgi:serine protease DegS